MCWGVITACMKMFRLQVADSNVIKYECTYVVNQHIQAHFTI